MGEDKKSMQQASRQENAEVEYSPGVYKKGDDTNECSKCGGTGWVYNPLTGRKEPCYACKKLLHGDLDVGSSDWDPGRLEPNIPYKMNY
ncbi:MAG: hypothetical protein C5S48_09835 [Candidatus Methanogaster sp.]|nr:MAG: hypothetical protein C5S48_09835 [ANME-2 cluster archaeon]